MRLRLLLIAWALALTAAAQSDTMTFGRGSLIIPMQGSYQRGNGIVAAYGLVWRILKSNDAGGFNASHPVTIYWVINGNKTSPNRCVPSNLHLPPAPNNGSWNDPAWNDGCDISIQNLTQQPVVPVSFTVGFPTSGIYPNATVPNFATTTPTARPAFPALTTLNNTNTPRFTTVQYMGGPFVIDAADAQNVIEFLRSGTDPQATQFITACAGSDTPSTTCHFVQLHQSTIEFTAQIGKRINKTPPKIALVDSASAGSVSSGILNTYLDNAGLDFTGAAGCPAGTFSGCKLAPGQIYDTFDANKDLISTATDAYGLLNRLGADGKPMYKVFWAPHWVGGNSTYTQYLPNGDGAGTNQLANAINNIAHFANQKGTGIFTECASLETYEGSYTGTGKVNVTQASTAGSFHYSHNILINGLTDGTSYDGRNCTDPDYLATATPRGECIVYPYPSDPFSQLGDFRYQSTSGHVNQYRPYLPNLSAYQPGLKRLAVSWVDYRAGTSYTDSTALAANADRGWDFFTLRSKDNDPTKATIVYLAGHSYTGTVAGNRIVLNTLLNLGAEPVGSERSLTPVIAYDDPNGTDGAGTRALAINGTYEAVAGYLPGQDTFDPARGSQWVFPYLPGHLRAHSLIGGNSLAAGASNLDASTLWDADALLPSPGSRNVFTYLGGRVTQNPALSGGRRVPHDVIQTGWAVENVSGLAINNSFGTAPNPNCVDVLRMGQTSDRAGDPGFGLIPGADGICDLQQALEYSRMDPGTDYGVSTAAANLNQLQSDFTTVQQLLQGVRGFCYATSTQTDGSGTPVLTPSSVAQCNSPDADNKAHLGGVVRSTAAIVPPSPNIPDATGARPTVAYVGGWDGQLHAIYVSGGAGYTGPASTSTFLNPSADAKFVTNWSSRFSAGGGFIPAPGTELWAFLPASQLPLLKTNNARVDSSPVVQDVFVDLAGTGVRSWHSVLVFSIGRTGREVAALDVTNPLKPVLLWDLVGSTYQVGGMPAYSPVSLANDGTGGTSFASKWKEDTAIFQPVPKADVGRLPTGLYDYGDMGGASALAVGQLRAGLEPVYAVIAATNSSGDLAPSKALEVFAIDVGTGQKLWQWEQPYSADWTDNTVPPGATILGNSDGMTRAYVGDMEGRLWELDAATGMNANVGREEVPGCTSAAPCKLAAFDAQSTAGRPQPITTNIGVAVLPAAPAAGTGLAGYGSATALIFGTAGADWVGASVPGTLHLLLRDAQYRLPIAAGGARLNGSPIGQSAALNAAEASGLLQEPTPFPQTLANGEHLYGAVSIIGSTVYFESANGAINDVMQLGAYGSGATYSFDLGGVPTSGSAASRFNNLGKANYGGVTAYHRDNGTSSKDYVLTAEVSKIENVVISNSNGPGPSSPNKNAAVEGQGGLLYKLVNVLHWFR